MKVVKVPNVHSGLRACDQYFHSIDEQSWLFVKGPEAAFQISYSGQAVQLQFRVVERYLQAMYHQMYAPVYKDSCVEFFISLDIEGKLYYNFEFNCIGNVLAGFGAGRNREVLPDHIIRKILTETRITNKNKDKIVWELNVIIPFGVFVKHKINSLNGQRCRANFYKCGDDLPEPHFLMWNKVSADQPDFHKPEYFGELIFD